MIHSMLGRSATVLLAALALAACGTNSASRFVGDAPTAEATYGQCAFCHQALAVNMTATGGHHDLDLKCESCHADETPGLVGPGHRSVPACADCHTAQQTHGDPAAGTAEECTVCHTPHGSPNLFLVRTEIDTPAGEREVDFTNLLGLADGSFASVSDPGTGLCETCHTTTRYYRSEGSGEPHFPFACFTCHPHAGGFSASLRLSWHSSSES
jgi:predicted CXXCH cytochrome family protein